MKRTLIVYYSRTGFTRRIAEELAELVDADLQPITEDRSREGIAEFFRSAIEAYRARPADIRPAQHAPDPYDLVIFGTPVWAGHTSSPMLGYLKTYKLQVHKYAAFCTEGGANGAVVLAQLAQIIGKPAEADLILTDEEIESGKYLPLLRKFASKLTAAETDHTNA